MKKISLILVVFFAIFMFGCNAKKEKTIDKNKPVTENVEENSEEFEYKEDENANNETEDVDTTDETTTYADDTETTDDSTATKTEDTKEPVMEENEDGSVKKVPENELKKEESKAEKSRVKKFYIIAGSFKNINNAVSLRSFYKGKGYPSIVLYPYHGYNRVAIGTYPNRATAEKDIKKVRKAVVSYGGEKVGYWLLWR